MISSFKYSTFFTLSLAVSLFIAAGCSGSRDVAQPKAPAAPITDTDSLLSYQDEITTQFLRTHLAVLAADSMKGRETATPGQKKAARYLVQQYREMGLKPIGDNSTYLQHFKVVVERPDSVVFITYQQKDSVRVRVGRSVSSKTSSADYIQAFGGTDTLDAPIVFAGFGVQDTAHQVTHLQGADLQGKWVMIFQPIPHIVAGDTLVDPDISGRDRFRTILQKGAAGILLIPNMTQQQFEATAERAQKSFGEASGMHLAYRGDRGGLGAGFNLVSPAQAAQLLGIKEGLAGLRKMQKRLVKHITEFKAIDTGYRLRHVPYISEITKETANVVALLKGADPQVNDEVVVLSAHYDHLGIGRPDSTGDAIYNGADDDGSGTVGVLNVAHALVQARKNGVRPRRSVLFLHVTGEEKGLLGSRYYSDHPIIPIEKTVADINVDMIGRIDSKHEKMGVTDYAYIIGGKLISSGLDSLVRAANARTGKIILSERYNDLNDPNQFYRRSDHWNFGRLGVPFVFFFTGVHEDYHQPSDEIEKIRFEKMAKIVRTLYGTTILVANTDTPPKVDNQAFIEATKVEPR